MVSADRGFNNDVMVGLMHAEVRIPLFTKGYSQVHAQDVDSTRELAGLFSCGECDWDCVCQVGYTILTGTQQICLVLLCEGEEVTFLVKMVTVCCAVTNMCPNPSVV